MSYVTVFPAPGKCNDWTVASRTGDVIRHQRLQLGLKSLDQVRGEAQRLFPDALVVMPGDPKPWDAPTQGASQ